MTTYYNKTEKRVWDNPEFSDHGYSGGWVWEVGEPKHYAIQISRVRGNSMQSRLGRTYILSLKIANARVLEYFITDKKVVEEIDDKLSTLTSPPESDAIGKKYFLDLCLRAMSIEEMLQVAFDIGVVAGRNQQQHMIKEALGM